MTVSKDDIKNEIGFLRTCAAEDEAEADELADQTAVLGWKIRNLRVKAIQARAEADELEKELNE
jgi:hypothetical protein